MSINTNKVYSKGVYNSIWSKNIKKGYYLVEVVLPTTRVPQHERHIIIKAYNKEVREHWLETAKKYAVQIIYEDYNIAVIRMKYKGFTQTVMIQKEVM